MIMVKYDFTNRTVIIIGAAGGIGKATAKRFAESGANLVIGDIDDRAKETATSIEENGGKAIFIQTDVTNPESVQNLVNKAVETYGGLDHAFNNAGILNAPHKFSDIPIEDYDAVMAVDAKGVFLATKFEIDYMRKHDGGSIVNTASVAGLIADPDMAPYIAAKHAVIGLTKSAGFDHAEEDIRVNALAPGLTETEMTQPWKDDPKKWAQMTGGNPMNSAAQPEDIADMVLFLCSDSARFANAQTFTVDGGQTAH